MCTEISRFRAGQRGISLVEVIIFIVIISVGVAGLMSVMNTTTKYSADPMIRKQAIAVAESLLEEIVLHPFTYCDPNDANALTATHAVVGPNPTDCATAAEATLAAEAGETRYSNATPYDNVNDYSGFSMNAGIYPVSDGTTLIPGLENYRANVTIAQAGAAYGLAPEAVLRVDVAVTDANGNVVTLTGYRFRYAPNATL